MTEILYDVIIIGSGPAGFSAAIYAVRSGRKTLLLSGVRWGGQLMLTTLVENYPGFPEGIQGPELMMNMRKQTERLGVEIVNADFEKADFSKKPFSVTAEGKIYRGKSVIIATGSDSIWLNVPGEIQLRGKGVSTCATCDALFLANVAKSVTIIHRRDKFRASHAMQQRVLANGKIKVLWNKGVTAFLGVEKVSGVKLKDTVTGKESDFTTDGVFVAIGHKPNSDRFKGIELDKKGYIVRKEIPDEQGLLKFRSATSVPGVFVGGDVHDYRYKQAITAAAYGTMAALDADKWLMEEGD